MKTWFIFDVTNYLGFTKRIAVWANNKNEALVKLYGSQEYHPMEIKFVGIDFFGELEKVEEFSLSGMTLVDMIIESGTLNLFRL